MGIYGGDAPRIAEAVGDLQIAVGEVLLPTLQRCVDAVVAQQELRAIGINPPPKTPKPNIAPPPQRPRDWQPASVGKTERLACRHCGDTPPSGAQYCITCGRQL